MTLAVLMSMDDKCFSIRVHTLTQLFSPSSSVARNHRISLSSIDSRSRDTKAPDQYGELSQWFGSSKNCDIAFFHYSDVLILVKCIASKNGHLKRRDFGLRTLNGSTYNMAIFITVFC